VKKVVIFGNSGSGKSTLAKELSEAQGLPHLDLDTLAWKPTTPPARETLAESKRAIDAFMASNNRWAIEGCYSDLLELVMLESSEIIYLDLPVETCISNARSRPWEPHKYASKEAQDANLEMLTEWIAQYAEREDTFSRSAHMALYRSYAGRKTRYTGNDRGA
jgi:adenylate kinase family enzyme